MKETVSGSVGVESIKRCYLGAEITVVCPDCKEPITHDFNEQYLSHPVIGTDDKVNFYCQNCDGAYEEGKHEPQIEWELPIKILSCDLVIEFDRKKLRKETY